MDYAAFIASKANEGADQGFEPSWLPDGLFDFQTTLTTWALRKGRAAIFADTGLGKTAMQLVWADNVVRRENRSVLLLTPLAVSHQTIAEAERVGVRAVRSREGARPADACIIVTNYERLHYFAPGDFAAVVCDESSILKSFDGATRGAITQFMRKVPYRLLCTATAAPNDYIELGTSSEALGYLGHIDMLGRFFKSDSESIRPFAFGLRGQFNQSSRWHLKGHAELPFWRWVCSWARAIRKPSDIGGDDARFVLPPLTQAEHVVSAATPRDGALFHMRAVGLDEQRDERRRTIGERCEKVADLVQSHDNSVIWCHLNAESDILARLIPNAVPVTGSDSVEFKEAAAEWFGGHRCICKDPMFRAILSRWRTIPNTSVDTTLTDGPSGSPRPKNTNEPMPRSDAPTCASGSSTTRSTSESTGAPTPSNETHDDAKGTPPTSSSETNTRSRSRSGSATTPISASRNGSVGSESPPPSTSPSLTDRAADALSVAVAPRSIPTHGRGAHDDSTSITATVPAASVDSCVPPATSASESSETTRSVSNGPRCICGHESGVRRIISKPTIFGYGINWQHCAHVTMFPSHSYEQTYQGIRRCWRFGQRRPVHVDVVTTEGERGVLDNYQRKARAADAMFDALVREMNHAQEVRIDRSARTDTEVPPWL